MLSLTTPAWLSLHGQGPVLQGAMIIAGTFVLEDAATVLAAMDVEARQVPGGLALAALYVGIVLGDLGLYGLGRLAATTPMARRWAPPDRFRGGRDWLRGNVFAVVFASRFLPGLRLPTYTACGFFGADFRRFALAAVGATLVWTTLLFGLSLRVGHYMTQYLGVWRWAGMVGFALSVILVGRLVARHRGARP